MKVQLSLSAIDLANLNSVAEVKFLGGDEIGVTEVASDTPSPTWSKTFIFDYDDGAFVGLNVDVVGDDGQKIGKEIFDVASILGAKGGAEAKQMGNGVIIVHLSEYVETGTFEFQFEGKKFEDAEKWFFNKSDPYFVVETVESEEVYRSETLRDNLNPTWSAGKVALMALCDSDLDKIFKITTYDENSKEEDEKMGSFETSVNKMISGAQGSGVDFNLVLNGDIKGGVYVKLATLSGYQVPSDAARKNMSTVGAAKILKLEVDRMDEAAKAATQVVTEAEAAAIEADAAAERARAAEKDALLAVDTAKAAADTAAAAVDAL